MTVLNHTIALARDADATALFYAEMLGLDPPVRLGHFSVVKVSSGGTDADHPHPLVAPTIEADT